MGRVIQMVFKSHHPRERRRVSKQDFLDQTFLALLSSLGYTSEEDLQSLWKQAEKIYKTRPATVAAAKQRAKRRENGQTPSDERPTASEVDKYIMEYAGVMFTTGEKFINYQDQNDWTLKTGNKIKDWRAVIRTWFDLYKEKNPAKSSKSALRI